MSDTSLERKEQIAKRRAYVIEHQREAYRVPEALARMMKSEGLYAPTTALCDIVASIKRHLKEIK